MSGILLLDWFQKAARPVFRQLLMKDKNDAEPVELLWLEDNDVDRGPSDHWFNRAEKKCEGTVGALRDLYLMAKNKQLVGVVAVGLTPDGRHHLLVTGEAYQRPYKAQLGLDRLNQAVQCLLPDLRAAIDAGEDDK